MQRQREKKGKWQKGRRKRELQTKRGEDSTQWLPHIHDIFEKKQLPRCSKGRSEGKKKKGMANRINLLNYPQGRGGGESSGPKSENLGKRGEEGSSENLLLSI